MNIVVTMAGLGSRFRKAGYDKPKYMVTVKGKTLFYWSMLSLYALKNNLFIFIARKEDNASSFIIDECKKLLIKHFKVIEIEKMTSGQAESAMSAKDSWKTKESLLIYNIDTYVEMGCLKESNFLGDGCIPCFHADGDHWSFVKLDTNGYAVEVREKKRISNNCSIGAYYFKRASLYEDVYEKFYKNEKYIEKGEKYIAPMYNWMISNEYKVSIQLIETEKVHVLGTPKEVENFRSIRE